MDKGIEVAVEDAMGGLLGGAVALHTLFTGFVQGGFTEDQALKLIAFVLQPKVDMDGGE